MRILVVHLSDIHVRTTSNRKLEHIDKVSRAVVNQEADVAVVAIVLSGDLAFSGLAAEYEIMQAKVVLLREEIAKTLKVPVHVIAAPGNHDCDFREMGSVRPILINSLSSDPEADFADDAIEQCAQVQRAFFEFRTNVENAPPTRELSRAYYEYSIAVGDNKVLFRCINTALTSTKDEKPMRLSYPVEVLEKARQYDSHDFVVSVYHHPSSWLEQTVQRHFRTHVESYSDLALTGHEHQFDAYTVSRPSGDSVHHIEGHLFQDSSVDDSGFNAIWVDLRTQRQRVRSFAWNGDRYEPAATTVDWRTWTRIGAVTQRDFVMSQEFQGLLDDPGANYSHPSGKDLFLKDIFVYPDSQHIDFENTTSHRKGAIVPGRELIKHVFTHRRMIFLGQERVGKTALARTLCSEFYRQRKVPVLLDGATLTSFKLDRFLDIVQAAAEQQYNDLDWERFTQLDRDQVVLLIDDFDHSKLNSLGRIRLLSALHERFPWLYIFTDESVQFEEAGDARAGQGFLVEYSQMLLLEFGYKLRSTMIRQWVGLHAEYDVSAEDLERRITIYETHIDDSLRLGYLPAYPFFVLALLQAVSGQEQNNAPAASYAKLQEILIVKALSKPNIVADIVTKEAYLAEIAYCMFTSGSRQLGEQDHARFHADFNRGRDTNLVLEPLKRELVASGIIRVLHRQISFKYSYHYYYFVAKYFSKQQHKPAIKAQIEALVSKIYRQEVANIWLFLTYFSNDPWLLNILLSHARSLFADTEPLTLDGDMVVLDTLHQAVPDVVLKDYGQLEGRERRRAAEDENCIRSTDEPTDDQLENDDVLRFVAKVNDALRTIEVLGQIVKTYAGQLESAPKREILQECYWLALRVLKALLNAWAEDPEKAIKSISDQIWERNRARNADEDVSREVLEKQVRSFIFIFSEVITFGVFKRLSHAVGSPLLQMSYDRLVADSESPSTAIRLIDASVRLDIDKIDAARILALHHSTHRKLFPNRMLKHLVVHYFRLFHTELSERQKICDKLGIGIQQARSHALLQESTKRVPE